MRDNSRIFTLCGTNLVLNLMNSLKMICIFFVLFSFFFATNQIHTYLFGEISFVTTIYFDMYTKIVCHVALYQLFSFTKFLVQKGGRKRSSTLSLTFKFSRSSRMRPFNDLIIVRQPKQNRALCLYNAFDFYSDIAHKTLLNFFTNSNSL